MCEHDIWKMYVGVGIITDRRFPSGPRGVLNSPSIGQMLAMMPRTTSLLSGKATMPIDWPTRVSANIVKSKIVILTLSRNREGWK